MARSTGAGEHRVPMPAAHGAGEEGRGAKPEKQLNRFVRCVAVIERLGNALGTLAFTWATVVLLGGYPTVLRPKDDFWFATAIVFLEAARMFSRNNRLDYQLFFDTRCAFRPLGWNGLIEVVFFTSMLVFLINYYSLDGPATAIPMIMAAVLAVSRFLFPGLLRLLTCNLLHRAVSLWSPLLPIIFLGLSVHYEIAKDGVIDVNEMAKVVVFLVLFLVLLLLAISRLQFPCITNLVGRALGRKQVLWHRVILSSSMLATGVMLVFMLHDPYDQLLIIVFEVSAVAILSLGNLQIPAAIVRIVLALERLRPLYYYNDHEKIDYENLGEKTNLTPSLNIFYGMVLGQGTLYGVACMLELFSFVPRRSLVRRAGLKGPWGVESVNMYYAYALDKCMEKDVLVPKKINLSSFAMDSLNSHSTKRQLHGIRILHSLLQTGPTRTWILSKLDASVETMARLIRMLGWTRPEDSIIRLFAAKAFCEVAKCHRIVTAPAGTMQLISTLLDADNKPERENTIFDRDDEKEEKEGTVTDPINSQERHNSVHDANGYQGQGQEALQDSCDLLGTQARRTVAICSNQQAVIKEQNSWCLRCWKRVLVFWSITPEEPLTDQDFLPALGMSIICSLAYYDQDNCLEISKVADLIPKIIRFTSYRNNMHNTDEVRQKIIMGSSFKLLLRLSNTGGVVGMRLRHQITEHPVLLSNLTVILNDSLSSLELTKLVVGILRNLAIEGNMSQEIGRIQVIISRLMDAFLSRAVSSNTKSDQYLQKVAGQALAMLTMESADNCAAMLMEPRNLIGELASMIRESSHKYVAAKLLQNLLLYIQPDQLRDYSNQLRKLCEALPKVLGTCMDAKTEGTELEVLIGLCSQICKFIPEYFAQELEKGLGDKVFVSWLVNTLKENMNPAVNCPGIRRAIIEQAIYLMKYSSRYTHLFNQCSMIEVLLMVKHTPSRVERYKIFVGNVGLMEHKEPLTNLVATANDLICRQWLQNISNVS